MCGSIPSQGRFKIGRIFYGFDMELDQWPGDSVLNDILSCLIFTGPTSIVRSYAQFFQATRESLDIKLQEAWVWWRCPVYSPIGNVFTGGCPRHGNR